MTNPKPPKRAEVAALARLEAAVPKHELYEILDRYDDPRVRQLMALMLDVDQHTYSLANICKQSGIPYHEVLKMLTSGRVGDGIEQMSRHVPKIFNDIGKNAENKMLPCPECKGGKLEVKGGCWVCDDTGKIEKEGSESAQEFVLKAFSVIDKNKGGTNVQVNVAGAGVASVEDDLELTGEVIDVRVESAQPE